MGPSLLAVYDYVADSFTKIIDVSLGCPRSHGHSE
jgi:hypothetical protein